MPNRSNMLHKQMNSRIQKYLSSPDSHGQDIDSVIEHLKNSFPRDYSRTKYVCLQ